MTYSYCIDCNRKSKLLEVNNIYSEFYRQEKCEGDHISYFCKKCKFSINETSIDAHIITCRWNMKIYYPSMSLCVRIHVLGEVWVFLDIENVMKRLPTLILFKLDYWSLFKKYVPQISNGSRACDIFIEDYISPMEIVNIIKGQSFKCHKCGLYYETIPSEDIVAQHRCAGSVGTNKVRSLLTSVAFRGYPV